MMLSTTGANRILKTAIAFVFWIGLWQLAAISVGQELILPAPLSVLKTLVALGGTTDFWLSALNSLLRILGGFLSGVVLGTVLAVLTSWSRLLDTLFSPALRVVRATPVASFIILALLWLGKARVPGFSAMLMVVPVIWGSVCQAIRGVDKPLLEMARMYQFGRAKTLRLIYIPSVSPAWSAASVTAMGLGWKAGIAAEVLCQPKTAIGTNLYYSKIYLETPALFAWTAVIIILSFILENGFMLLMKRYSEPKNGRDLSDGGAPDD